MLFMYFNKTYRLGTITDKFSKVDGLNTSTYNTRYNYYFIVNYNHDNIIKAKTIKVTVTIFDKYKSGDIIPV